METTEFQGKKYPLVEFKEESDAFKGKWIRDDDGIDYLIVQVMNDSKEPYMMIRALDGRKIKLVNQPEYVRFKLIDKENPLW